MVVFGGLSICEYVCVGWGRYSFFGPLVCGLGGCVLWCKEGRKEGKGVGSLFVLMRVGGGLVGGYVRWTGAGCLVFTVLVAADGVGAVTSF